jgi:hypothetical protein
MPYEFKHKPNVTFDDYLKRHEEWGHATFGSPADGRGPLGPLNHIEKEIVEIKEDPTDLKEWIDLIIIGMDGFRATSAICPKNSSFFGIPHSFPSAMEEEAYLRMRSPSRLAPGVSFICVESRSRSDR